jgi:hypothetical protein
MSESASNHHFARKGSPRMKCSQARIDANRRNAQKSTGPRTVEGKLASRANAITHGLCSVTIVPESPELIQQRSDEIFDAFKPYTEYQAWQVGQAAIITIRIDRIERMERRIRDKICLRAELTWDDDRRLEAEVLGGKLSKRPAQTIELLRRTPHGCEWLMARWALLAHAADNQSGNWTAEQNDLAFDLMGTPVLFRVGKAGTSVDFHGNVLHDAEESAVVARRMVDELMEQREVARKLDDVNRALTEADLDHDSDAELRRLRRYESTMHNRLRWTIKQLTFQGPEGKPDEALRPRVWTENPVPELGPEPLTADEKAARDHDPNSPHPPFCLKPEEFPAPGEKADIPEILKSRKQKREAKTKANREAERRKIEKHRA